MKKPQSALINGNRLHLQHGPIDLVIGVDPPEVRRDAFLAARARFETVLDGLVAHLTDLRAPLQSLSDIPDNPIARRMYAAAGPFMEDHDLTPMIAVAGAVADDILAAILADVSPGRAYVNNGGDIAIHLGEGEAFSIAMASPSGADTGRIHIKARDAIGGIATSGAGGRSHSLGIAESVTVLAASAAEADAAATLIANAVDLPDHPHIGRVPASALNPDSDLGARLVTTEVPQLSDAEVKTALAGGKSLATRMVSDRRIRAAALFLQGQSVQIGEAFADPRLEPVTV